MNQRHDPRPEYETLESVRARLSIRRDALAEETSPFETLEEVEEAPVYLLGNPAADFVGSIVAGLVPALLLWASIAIPWRLYEWGLVQFGLYLPFVAVGLAVAELVAFFVALRPYRTVRIGLSVSLALYTLVPAALLGYMVYYIAGPGSGETWEVVACGAGAVGLVVLQAVLFRTATRRR